MKKLLRKSVKLTGDQEQKLDEALIKIQKQKDPSIYTSVAKGFKVRVKNFAVLRGVSMAEYTRIALKQQLKEDRKRFKNVID